MAAMLGQSRRWKCADGIHRDLTAAQLQQLAVEINTRMQAYYDKEETIADIIRNSQDVQSVNIQELWELN
jgi:histidinol phosphatase-like PHP family hydrolase